ncbi:MAG TPA: ferredoxin [candidate division WWE3 bacterium]|uniref:Ferredoxin n=1 Tax=candidate division WWE3 bacterium TaxID=2053526 RepID=A0A7C1DHP7_UNCKA|nr:ferredoxin [candidate division WWE3 bacterium]
MIKTIKVDESACVGCGACTIVSPEFFEINANGVSQFKGEEKLPIKEAEKEELLIKVAQACPVKAISIYNENGEKIFPK